MELISANVATGFRGYRRSQRANLAPETFERVQAMRRQVYDSEDYQEGIREFYEKRGPRFQGK